MAWTDLTFAFGSKLTATKMTQLDDNLDELVAKAAGAPVLANGYVVQAMLSTTTGEVSKAGTPALTTLPGGTYGFYPQIKVSATGATTYTAVIAGEGSVDGTAVGTSYLTRIYLGTGGATTAYAQQRYVQSSPPYDLGDGEVPLFVFALVDGSGNVVSTYVSPDPPWAHNGPTRTAYDRVDKDGRRWQRRVTRPDARDASRRDAPIIEEWIEVTQAVKQADMGLIPHPFDVAAGHTVVLIDPVADLTARLLELHEAGESIAALLHGGYLRVDNAAVARNTPPGVAAHPLAWRVT